MKSKKDWLFTGVILLLLAQGCNMPVTQTQEPESILPPIIEETSEPVPTVIEHQDMPISAPEAKPYPDVTSVDTASENRAP